MSEEVRTVSASGGAKGTKPEEVAWLDPRSILEVGAVASMGAHKYGNHNFRNGYEWSKCYNALHRHLAAFWGGQDVDEESGLPHMAHAAWHCLALLTFMREHGEYDDRYSPDHDITPEVQGVWFKLEPEPPKRFPNATEARERYAEMAARNPDQFGDPEENRRKLNNQRAWGPQTAVSVADSINNFRGA